MFQDILYLRHERVTKKMSIIVSPFQLRILLLFLSEGVYAEALEIPLLSSFSSPVHVLNKVYPDTIFKMEVHLSDVEKKMLRIDRHGATRLLMYERGQRESTYQESLHM